MRGRPLKKKKTKGQILSFPLVIRSEANPKIKRTLWYAKKMSNKYLRKFYQRDILEHLSISKVRQSYKILEPESPRKWRSKIPTNKKRQRFARKIKRKSLPFLMPRTGVEPARGVGTSLGPEPSASASSAISAFLDIIAISSAMSTKKTEVSAKFLEPERNNLVSWFRSRKEITWSVGLGAGKK